jgi:hypothetical protein
MTLFHCSLLALKAQEESGRIVNLDDRMLHDKVAVFRAKIRARHDFHGLRLFKDKVSGGIQPQANNLGWPLEHSPVWTVFINYNMLAHKWITLLAPGRVYLPELSRYIFTNTYEQQMASTDEHDLEFWEWKTRCVFSRP